MEERLKQRLVGAVVLASFAVVFVPILLDAPHEEQEEISTIPITEIPERPQDGFGSSVSISLDLPDTPRLDIEVERERNRHASSADAGDGRDPSDAPSTIPAPSEAPASNLVSGAGEPPAPASRSGSSTVRSEPASPAQKSGDSTGKKQAVEKPVTVAGRWTVQLGSFQKSENALALRKRLQAKGYPAFVESGPSAQGEVSRVLVGPLPGREQAKDSAAKLRREMALEGIVVPYPGG